MALSGTDLAADVFDGIDAQFDAPGTRSAEMTAAIVAQWEAMLDYLFIDHAADVAAALEPHLTGITPNAAGLSLLGNTSPDPGGVTSILFEDVAALIGAATTAQLALKSNIASPTFTGTPAAPTAAGGTNTTQIATTAFVKAAIDALVAAAPGVLDTLDELAAALGDDANFATTMTTALALKAPLASPALTGNPTAPTQTAGNNSTRIATTAYVDTGLGTKAASSHTHVPADITVAASSLVGNTAGSPGAASSISFADMTDTHLPSFGEDTRGIVDPPGIADGTKYLRDDGTWDSPPGSGTDGNLINVRVLTSGTSYTPTSGTTKIFVEVVGGGGGGGGGTRAASAPGAAAGGGGGGYAGKWYTGISDATSYTYAIGGAGSAGNSSGGAGGAGGDTTFDDGVVVITGQAGGGGAGMLTGSTALIALGGTEGGGVNGDVNCKGGMGGYGIRLSGTVSCSGIGGASGYFGGGGRGSNVHGFGTASSRGAGGGGANAVSANLAGGAGAAGMIIIHEYS